jgi:hypothetical protein
MWLQVYAIIAQQEKLHRLFPILRLDMCFFSTPKAVGNCEAMPAESHRQLQSGGDLMSQSVVVFIRIFPNVSP